MANPFFSVILTTYNRADLLKLALKSLKAQTFKDFEVFIYDDASTDNTADVIKSFQGEPGWKFVKLDENHGYPYSKNLAFKELRGRYVAFLDSDDVWMPNKLEIFHKYINLNPSAGFIFSNGYIHQDNHVISKMFGEKAKIPSGKLPAYMAVSNYWLPYVTTNVVLKKEAVDSSGSYREDMTYLGDTEYFARVIGNYETLVIPEPLSIYKIHPASITQKRDRCIDESIMTLESAKPPREIYVMLYDLIYMSQAIVLIKNGQCTKARELLGKVKKKDLRYYKTYISALLPAFILAAARLVFKRYRIAKLMVFAPPDYKNAEIFLNTL